jgi:anaerobic selenocysteine-containing dehydrogenase
MNRGERMPAICGVCPAGCAIIASLENGRLIKTEPDTQNPYGALCVRGKAAPEIVYSRDRLTTPLVRVGERGKGEFRTATWDEVLDLTAKSMQEIKRQYGPEAMMYHYGRGAFEQSASEFGKDWLYPFGSPNVAGVGSLCAVSANILAPMPTFGIRGWNLDRDVENSKTIVVWGANPLTDSPPFMLPRIINAQKRGARVIAIDHMRSDIANRAHQWIPVRSGTDGALALGMLRCIINENIYDREFAENWTVGFDELKQYVQKFTPEEVEKITWVPAAAVQNLAREIAGAKHASLIMYTGLEYTNSGVQNIRAVLLLWALTGNLDVPGGLCISPTVNRRVVVSDLKPPDDVARIGAREYPLFDELVGNAQYMEMPKAVLQGDPYPVKGILINGASTLINYPQPEILENAYRNLDFLAVIDIFMTRDALFADVIFPASSLFEKNSYQRYPDYVRLRKRVIEPQGDCRNDVLILAAIADRLGYGSLFPQTEEEILQKAFAGKPELLETLKRNPDGVNLGRPERKNRKWELGLLRPDGKPGFNTPSGKVEIASSMLKGFGYDGLPIYVDPVEGPLFDPKLASEYPLILNTGARLINTFRSQHLNIRSLVKLQDKPLVLINPTDALHRKISDGDKVIVYTSRGSVSLWAKVTDAVMPGGVEVNVGGGSPIQTEAWRDANVNFITDFYNRDPISGFPIFKALLCEIKKAEAPDRVQASGTSLL